MMMQYDVSCCDICCMLIAWDSWPSELPSAAEVRSYPEYMKLTDEAGQRDLRVEVHTDTHTLIHTRYHTQDNDICLFISIHALMIDNYDF